MGLLCRISGSARPVQSRSACPAGQSEESYLVGGRIFLANVPEGSARIFEPSQAGPEKDAARHGDESSEEYASRKKIIDQMESYLTRVFGEMDQVVFGWGLDRSAETTFVDVSLTAKPGTKTAEEMGLAAKATTNFAGFRVPVPRSPPRGQASCRLPSRKWPPR